MGKLTGQPIRYLIAGAANTLFGIVDTMFFTWLFLHLVPGHEALMTSAATVVATPINISVSFFSYKYFVFCTKGNTLREYLRSFLVYLPSLLIGASCVAPLTVLLRRQMGTHAQLAPYMAQACIIGATIVLSFLGHKHITFRRKSPPAETT